MSIAGIRRAAAIRTFVKIQCVCLVVFMCAGEVAEGLYSMRFDNRINLMYHSYMIPLDVLTVFIVTAIPALVFSAIVSGVLIKRMRMQLPMWKACVLFEAGLLLLIAASVTLFFILLVPIFPMVSALRLIASISIIILPIAGLGILSCQRVLNKHMKEITQPTTPPFSMPGNTPNTRSDNPKKSIQDS